MTPWDKQLDLLATIPGVDRDAASAILIEVGPDIESFASRQHFAAWAGPCPGNNKSGGKRRLSAHPHGRQGPAGRPRRARPRRGENQGLPVRGASPRHRRGRAQVAARHPRDAEEPQPLLQPRGQRRGPAGPAQRPALDPHAPPPRLPRARGRSTRRHGRPSGKTLTPAGNAETLRTTSGTSDNRLRRADADDRRRQIRGLPGRASGLVSPSHLFHGKQRRAPRYPTSNPNRQPASPKPGRRHMPSRPRPSQRSPDRPPYQERGIALRTDLDFVAEMYDKRHRSARHETCRTKEALP